jgi:thioredoxin-related protein
MGTFALWMQGVTCKTNHSIKHQSMKKIVAMLLLAVIGSTAAAQIKWHKFEEAVELCKKRPKKIFIDVYTDWCGWCKVYDKNTFGNPDIAEYMNKHFYAVKFNAEGYDTVRFMGRTFVNPGGGRRSTHMLATSLLNGKMSYPSVVFLNEQFQLLHVQPGYLTPEQFAPFMVYIGDAWYDPSKNTSWEIFSKDFKWPPVKKAN